MLKKFVSRKLIMTLVGLFVSASGLPIPGEAINTVVQLIMVYVGGQSVVDAVEKHKDTSGE